MSNLPIDISVSKMIDWIIDRRHCQITWQKKAVTAHSALKKAMAKTDDELDQVLAGYGLSNEEDGFLVVHLLNQYLLEKDGGTGWTGIGATERSKLWNGVLSIYTHENVHLAEAATHLTRLVQKVYPSLDRNIQKAKSKQDECVTRSGNLLKASKAAEKRFQTDCEKLGIDPEQPPKEQLVQSLVNLPSIVQSISESFTHLEPIIDYYVQFMNFTSGEAECLTNLKILCSYPQCTAYEILHNKRPTTVLRDAIIEDVIDFDIDEYAIDMVEEFEIEEDIEDIEVEEENVLITQNIVAKGDEAKYVLENSQTRALIMDDLAELEFFLLGLGTNQNVPKDLKTNNVEQWTQLISNIYSQLNDEQTTKLLQLSDDQTEADRLVDKLNKHKVMGARRLRESEQAIKDKETFIKEEHDLTQQKEFIAKQITVLKEFLEKSISEKYQKRPVNIQGCRL